MIVAVTGGKGGTGKTSVAVSLAHHLQSMGRHTVLVDADVEAPNVHIITGAEMREVETVTTKFPRINEEKCIKCGLCARACPTSALAFIPGKIPLFFKENCVGCMLCQRVCPVGAIEAVDERTGAVREGNWGEIPVVDGIADVGVEETAKIVEAVLKRALERTGDIKIIDTAAGIHCNVARAIMAADMAIAVTEPTPFGIRDMRKAIQLVQALGKPMKIVANKWGINERYEGLIRQTAENLGVPLHTIPFSKDYHRRYAQGTFQPLPVEGIL